MECKNCKAQLYDTHNFCPECGAKVIRNRLSFQNLWEDFKTRFLDYDNTFLITLSHLFSRPEQVIGGYISGVRKRYMDPLSYLGIALTLTGVQIFVTRKISDRIDWDVYNQEVNPELTQKLMDAVFDYSSLIFLLYIPVFAFAARVTMNMLNFYFSEAIIIFVYIMAQWSIAFFLPTLVILLTFPEYYMQLSFPILVFIIMYSIYCLQRLQNLSIDTLVWRSLLFIFMVLIGYIGIIIVIYCLLFATGTITLHDFVPTK